MTTEEAIAVLFPPEAVQVAKREIREADEVRMSKRQVTK